MPWSDEREPWRELLADEWGALANGVDPDFGERFEAFLLGEDGDGEV